MSRKKGPTKEDRRRERFETLVRLRQIRRMDIQTCANEMRVSYRTIQYWLADPDYQETAKQLQEEWKGAAETRIAEMAQMALDTMADVMQFGKSDVARVNAASKMLDAFGIGTKTAEGERDDRAELARITEILASRPNVVVQFEPPEAGGLLPAALQNPNKVTLDTIEGELITKEENTLS